jgi:subtilisin family serine protease
VIISNNVPGAPPILGGSGTFTIPSVSISLADGAAIEGELAAPVNVTLRYNSLGVFDQVLSSCKAGWCFAYGTSMAAPAASGVAALIKAAHPRLSLGALKAKLAQTADDKARSARTSSTATASSTRAAPAPSSDRRAVERIPWIRERGASGLPARLRALRSVVTPPPLPSGARARECQPARRG